MCIFCRFYECTEDAVASAGRALARSPTRRSAFLAAMEEDRGAALAIAQELGAAARVVTADLSVYFSLVRAALEAWPDVQST